MIAVLVAAEVRIYREGIAEALRRRAGVDVVGLAGSADESVERTRALEPELLVCDAAMNGALRAMQVVSTETSTRILALGVAAQLDEVLRCAAAGASGYVTTDASLDELEAAVHATMRAELTIEPRMAAALLVRAGDLVRTGGLGGEPEARLTARELEIVALIDAGLSNKEIAARLSIQVSTVKNHVHRILEKLEVTARDDAAAAVRTQLRI